MHFLLQLVNYFLHIDKHLFEAVSQYGSLVYAILFAIIFMETGLVIVPFLPGDTLLFAAGALAAGGSLNIWLVLGLVFLAAFLGDTVNYWLGYWIGPRAFNGHISLLKKSYLHKAQAFYDKHGGKAIMLSRFVPIVRTFAPFVAGIGKMKYSHFLIYNLMGGFLWVAAFVLSGFFFGSLPIVKDNFHYLVLMIGFISLAPIVWEFFKAKQEKTS